MIKTNPSLLSNVSFIYCLVWLPLVAITRLDLFFFSVRPDFLIELYIVFFILSFFVMYGLVYFIFSNRGGQGALGIDDLEIYALRSFTIKLFWVWLAGFCLNILFSGGLPIIWVLLGESRTYSDFGIPTFSGMFNMVRMFILISLVICMTNKVPIPKYIAIIMALSLFSELNRAAIMLGLLVVMASFLMFNKLKTKSLLKMLGGVLLFIIIFAFISEFRELGRGNYNSPSDYFNEDVAGLGASMYIVLYYVTPLNNLYHQYSLGFDPSYTPFFTLNTLLPTVIRDQIYTGDTVYSVNFASEVFNTTPYLANIIADFGMGGASIIIVVMQFLFCYVCIRANRNSLSHLLMHCMIWSATVLSVFTNLYFALIFVLFPVLIAIFSRYKRRYIKYHLTRGERAFTEIEKDH